MARITQTEYGYREFNQGWGELSSKTYYEDSATIINTLYEEFGERLWTSINPVTSTKTVILLSRLNSANCGEVEFIIEEEF